MGIWTGAARQPASLERRVLIADDDPNLRKTLCAILVARGYAPSTASTGSEALQAVRKGHPPICLIDLRLSDMSGLELLRDVKALSPDIECIMITGHASQASAIEAVNLGAHSYVLKPYDVEQLLVTIQRAIEKQQAGRALRETIQTLQALIEASPLSIVVLNPKKEVQLWNPAAERTFGWHEREVLGQPNPIVPKDREMEFDALFERTRQNDVFGSTDLVRQKKNGELINVSVSRAPLVNSEGEFIGEIGIIADITHRKRAEQALRDNERRFRTIANFTYDMEQWISPEGNLIYVSPSCERLTGYGVNEFLQDPKLLERITHPADRATVTRHLREDLSKDQALTLEFRIISRSGEERWIEHVCQSVHSEEGGWLGRRASNRDITERKQAEEERTRLLTQVQEQAQLVQQIVDTVPEGIILLDSNRRVILVNPIADADLSVLAGIKVGDLLTHLGDRSLAELLVRPLEGTRHRVTASTATSRHFEVIAQPIQTGPTSGGWVLVVRDVTDEQEVRRRVQQQGRLAAVGQLAAGIAHDFNSYLTTVMLYSDMLLHRPQLPVDLAPGLKTILNESRTAAQLVQQILDFSRRSLLDTQRVDLNAAVEKTAEILRRTLPANISFLLNLGPRAYVVNADPTRVQQILMNLALNARDAMPHGGQLCIALTSVEVEEDAAPPAAGVQAGEWVLLTVSDTGTGIPHEALAHIFDPFFTTKPPGKGTGLGLAQVYGIVAQHEGHIAVDTEVGRGTTFRIYLPTYREEQKRRIPAATVSALQVGQGEAILLVEDEQKIRELGQAALDSLGYRVLTAADGREALDIYTEASGVDLVVTDIVMPEMGGKELLRTLRRLDPGIKAMAITGYSTEEDLLQLRAEGFLGIVNKPFDVEDLAKAVSHALGAA